MRLIDAEEFEVISWSAQGQTAEYERGHDDGVSFVLSRVDRAPTIDAIPLSWLTEQEYGGDEELSVAANVVVRAWLTREQEAG